LLRQGRYGAVETDYRENLGPPHRPRRGHGDRRV